MRMYKIEKGMNQVDKDYVKELSVDIRGITPHFQSDDITYVSRPEALKIAQVSFDAAVKELDAAVRLPLKERSKADEITRYNAGGLWSDMVGDIALEYMNLAIKVSKILDRLDTC